MSRAGHFRRVNWASDSLPLLRELEAGVVGDAVADVDDRTPSVGPLVMRVGLSQLLQPAA